MNIKLSTLLIFCLAATSNALPVSTPESLTLLDTDARDSFSGSAPSTSDASEDTFDTEDSNRSSVSLSDLPESATTVNNPSFELKPGSNARTFAAKIVEPSSPTPSSLRKKVSTLYDINSAIEAQVKTEFDKIIHEHHFANSAPQTDSTNLIQDINSSKVKSVTAFEKNSEITHQIELLQSMAKQLSNRLKKKEHAIKKLKSESEAHLIPFYRAVAEAKKKIIEEFQHNRSPHLIPSPSPGLATSDDVHESQKPTAHDAVLDDSSDLKSIENDDVLFFESNIYNSASADLREMFLRAAYIKRNEFNQSKNKFLKLIQHTGKLHRQYLSVEAEIERLEEVKANISSNEKFGRGFGYGDRFDKEEGDDAWIFYEI